MKPLQIIVLLFYFSEVTGYGYVSDTIAADPCADYRDLSFKHPKLTLADLLWDTEQFEKASSLYQMAAVQFEDEQNWRGLVKARNRISSNLRLAGQYDSALAILNINLQIISEHLNNDLVEMAEVHFIIGTCYDWSNANDVALQAYNKALEIRTNLYGEYHIDVYSEYHAIGDMYAFDDQTLNAIKYLSRATDILSNIGCESSLKAGETYYSLASAYRELGDFDKATIYGIKALSILENSIVNDKTRCYQLLGNINLEKQNYKQALRYFFTAIDIQLDQKPLTNTQKMDLSNFFNSVGSTYLYNQEYDSAQKYYLKSLKIYQNMAGIDDHISIVYQNIGSNYSAQGQFDSANVYLFKAINLRKRIFGDKHYKTSTSFRFTGNHFESMGELDSALHYYQQAIVAGSGENFSRYQPDENPGVDDFSFEGSLLDALWAKGVVFRRIYQRDKVPIDLEHSLETLLVAVELMDRNQELYELEGSTLIMARDYYRVFEEALNACYRLYDLTDDRKYLETAFFIMEKSKARLLFDTFSDLQQSRIVGIPDSVLEVENSIKSQLASFTRDLDSEKKQAPTDNQIIKTLEENVFQSTVSLETFYESLETTYPSYTSAVKSELLDLNTIQDRLSKEHQVLVDYFWGDSALFSLVIKEDQVEYFRKPIASVKLLVKNYQEHLLDGPQFTNQATRFREFSENAHALYESLFKGVKLEDKSLIIAADGPLRFIPFEGLVVEEPENNTSDYDQLKYVVHYYPTSYVYSANLWAMQPKRETRKLQALGFSHSDLDNEQLNGPNELPGTAREIAVLKSQLKGSFFSGLEATKQHFIDHAQDYDIIHLAIHGISDSISHLNNRLLFRRPDKEDQTDPLYTYELYNLRLNLRLAVLSACESGLGRNFRGEGVYSMSRAFSYAGCPTTVMSLWRISDKTTPEILERFYQQIFKGADIDQALRKAKLGYLSENSGNMAHPGLWAAMVVHGATNAIVKQSKIMLVLILGVLSILTLTILLRHLIRRLKIRR